MIARMLHGGTDTGVREQKNAERPRLKAAGRPARIYAIGDVHGYLERLVELERHILDDGTDCAGERWIVMIGDYVDRGPQSAQVLDHLLAPLPKGWHRICLCGNHELAMLSALSDHRAFRHWLRLGGESTLRSYGLDAKSVHEVERDWIGARSRLLRAIPAAHRRFLQTLPVMLETPDHIFVHAGLRPGVPTARQSEEDMVWIRDAFLESDHDFGRCVVHGHTPVKEAQIGRGRINLDSGVYIGGVLSAVRIEAGTARVLTSAG
ncbi:metallophosphoesterase family protein [Pelagibacterium montanilacus]|uniref:metallophosphoesterase family protein n=1 Tax=Pelagibacterium montanilacus TaxID=2185280 RepID=UPI000F8DE03E|nr:metallophosphoesterase family protein [Pelagibacterium montanilacus]